jgi:uncharacterized protein (TIGR02147 family)
VTFFRLYYSLVMTTLDCSSLLRSELLRKKRKNPSYSLRSFARDIDVSPAFLSQVLSGKKNLSVDRAKKIAMKIGWGSLKRRRFSQLAELSGFSDIEMKKDMSRIVVQKQLEPTWTIREDQVECVAGWYHFALVELAKVNNGLNDLAEAASALGIGVAEAKDAVLRLVRVGLLQYSQSRYIATQKNYSAPDIPSQAVRLFHATHLDKAKIAQEQQPIHLRDITGVTVATDPQRIAGAKMMIRDFRRELTTYLEGGEPKQVFHLGVQLFRLDR